MGLTDERLAAWVNDWSPGRFEKPQYANPGELKADIRELLAKVGRLRGEQERLREALQRRIDADAEGEPIDPSYDGEGCDCSLCAEDRALLRALVGEQDTTTTPNLRRSASKETREEA